MSDLAAPAVRVAPAPVIYPQQQERAVNWLDRLETAVTALPVRCLSAWWHFRLRRLVVGIAALSDSFSALDEQGLRAEAEALRALMRLHGLRDDLAVRCLALARETAARTIGLRAYDTQVMGSLALLGGMVAEMETGEGKTLTAALAAVTAAFAGLPVHIVTVNDYLARRDSDEMDPIYRSLGLSVGTVVHGRAPEQRRAAYACDVTYCSNKEVAFDYLRDRIVLGSGAGNLHLKLERLYGRGCRWERLVLRGLPFAIVDEVDSILIDEAITPLIISGETQPEDEQRWAEQALELAKPLEEGRDYRIRDGKRLIELTVSGRKRLSEDGEKLGGMWRSRIHREESARQALTALHLFRADEHYLVRDQRVQIVDEYTGRVMPDRSWSEGLHQLIEQKEGCPVTGRKMTLARISYQRFFRRYRRLAGMTGTAGEVAGELWAVYRLPVLSISPNRPLRRVDRGCRICRTTEQKWETIVARVRLLQREGRPVLIGTRSVAASEALSERLAAAGIEHVVLSAAQDHHEADVIARAGEPGRVTVATNMAGRGVDIRLAEGVAERGGLHVILSERHDAGRIDRQLAGRCGRQGDPGSFEFILSREDPLLDGTSRTMSQLLSAMPGPLGRAGGCGLFARAQTRTERLHSRMRRDLLRSDQQLGAILSFSGATE